METHQTDKQPATAGEQFRNLVTQRLLAASLNKQADGMKGKTLVAFFYPKDFSPGCTKQACAFRDANSRFEDKNAVLVGISADTDHSHKQFIDKHKLPFPLLADADGQLRKTLDVPKSWGFLPGRVTYVIDPNGKILLTHNSQLQPKSHIEKALSALP